MPQAFYILLGAMVTVLTCLALGALLFRRLALTGHRGEMIWLEFFAGAACLHLIVFALATAGLARKGVFLAVAGLAVAGALRWRDPLARRPRLPALPRLATALFGAVFAMFAVLYLVNAMAPEYSPDGSSYHLGLVARYYREHGFRRITNNMYANLSQGLEMLFLFAYSVGRHSAAALVHCAFLLAAPLAMLSYARRFGFGRAGAAGALFFFLSPVAGRDGTAAYNDVAVAAVLFALFYLLEIWREEQNDRLLIPAGLLAGFAFAVKYTAFLAVPYALGVVAWKLVRMRRPLLKPLATLALAALVMAAPWLAKNALWLGNPVSPFFNAVFPNPHVHVSFERDYARYMRHFGEVESYASVPLETTVGGGKLGGVVGPLFLLAPLALLALRYPHGRRLLVAGVVFGAPYLANIGTRFLLPLLPFLSLALALAVRNSRGVAVLLVAAHALASWPAALAAYVSPYAWRLADLPLEAALRIEPEEHFLRRVSSGYLAARLIEEQVPPSDRVLAFTQIPEAYTSRQVAVAFQSAHGELLRDFLLTPLIPDLQPVEGLRFRFPETPLRRLRVVQTASGESDQWSVTELRVLRGGRELARDGRWRLRAHPNRWDVQLAFDNSPVTRWRSWRAIEPGMFLEVDFGRLESADEVLLERSPDQYKAHNRLDGLDASGRWRTLAAAGEPLTLPKKSGLRRAAVEEVKRSGIKYLLVFDEDFGAGDFLGNFGLWRIKPVSERAGARLYRID